MANIKVEVTVNGKKIAAEVSQSMSLLKFLREKLGLTGAKMGCGEGYCGSCTVIIDGKAQKSCLVPVSQLNGSNILTIEGLKGNGDLHPLQRAFAESGAIQCGFCTPGIIMASKALLDENHSPTDLEIKEALARNYCRCAGYLRIIDAVKRAARAMGSKTEASPERTIFAFEAAPGEKVSEFLGKSPVKKDAIGKALGLTRYADDMSIDGMLHGKVLWSPLPHAKIISLDKSKACSLQGVKAVLTYKDVPGLNLFGVVIPDEPVLAQDRVRSVGDRVAVVFAQDEETAEEALKLIDVEYEPLEAICDPVRALEPSAQHIHEGGNILVHKKLQRGDVGEGFARSDIIVEHSYFTPFVEHAYLEPESGLAVADDDGGLTLWMATQCPHRDRDQIAAALAMPKEKVRLAQTPIGGAYGGKEDITIQILLALGALATKRPVKMTLSRQESLRSSTKRHAIYMDYKVGAAEDGRLMAVEALLVGDTGAYASLGAKVLEQALIFSCGPYQIPNVKNEAIAVYTNNIRCGAMRGFGINQVAFAMESQLDIIAKKLGIDPFDLRLLNALDAGKRTVTGQLLKASVGLKETLTKARERLASTPMPKVKGKLGIGVASGYKNVGIGYGVKDSAGADLELMASGRVLLKVGAPDMGQGSDTVLAQLVSEELDIDYNQVDIVSADTAHTPDGGPSVAQRVTYISGNAVIGASKKFKSLLIDQVAKDFALAPEVICFSKEVFFDSKSNKPIVKLADLARATVAEGQRLSASHVYTLPRTFPLLTVSEQKQYREGSDWLLEARPDEIPLDSEEYRNYCCYSFVTHVAIVEVDERTGDVKVHKIIAAHDCGKLLNPLIARGQIEGSAVMGMGYALSEEFVMEEGFMRTDTLAKCRIPNFKSAPAIDTIIIENPEPGGPFGAKGISEVATVPTAPAIINAIFDAVGVRITSLPANKKKVARAVEGKFLRG